MLLEIIMILLSINIYYVKFLCDGCVGASIGSRVMKTTLQLPTCDSV